MSLPRKLDLKCRCGATFFSLESDADSLSLDDQSHSGARAMIRAMRTVWAVWFILSIAFAIASRTASAQTTTAPTGPPREPPVMRFDPQGIDLVQAVTVTLQNSPDIQLSEATAQQS